LYVIELLYSVISILFITLALLLLVCFLVFSDFS
jgi:hypothetical protein